MDEIRKIFILEDDEKAMAYIEYLSNYHNIHHAKRICDAIYYLDDGYQKDSKINNYDYFIFDANVPSETVRLSNGERREFQYDDGLNGLSVLNFFYNNIDRKRQKIVIITAYANVIRERNEIKKLNIPIIDKSSENFTKKLMEFFK